MGIIFGCAVHIGLLCLVLVAPGFCQPAPPTAPRPEAPVPATAAAPRHDAPVPATAVAPKASVAPSAPRSPWSDPLSTPEKVARIAEDVKALYAIREGLLERTVGASWGMGGRVKLLHYLKRDWHLAEKRIKAFRLILRRLIRQPVGIFFRHTRAFVKIAEMIKWGEKTGIAHYNEITLRIDAVRPVIEAFPGKRPVKALGATAQTTGTSGGKQ